MAKPKRFLFTIIFIFGFISHPVTLFSQIRHVTLDEAVNLALQANASVVQARGQVEIARAGRREAMGNYLPTISASSGLSRSSSTRFDPTTQLNVTSPIRTSNSAGLNSSIQLFNGFRRLADSRAANANFASAYTSLVNQNFQVTLQTKQTFFTVLASDELVRVAETRIERVQQQLKVSKEKFAAGAALRSDTLRARVDLGNALLTRLNAQTQRATAEANLARLIGIDGPVRAKSDPDLLTIVPLDTITLRSQALRHSPSVAQAEAAVLAAQAGLSVARSRYFPSVNASFSNSWAGDSFNTLKETNTWSARLNLSFPLLDGFSRESNIVRATATKETSEAQAHDARRLVNAQLTQYLAEIDAAEARLEIAQATRVAAWEDLRVQQDRYRIGTSTIVEVMTSQESFDQAEVDVVQARLDFLIAKAQIEALVGRKL